jgi:DNA-binding response OmpR family regulator
MSTSQEARMKVLLVDTETDLLDVAAPALRSDGFAVSVATTGDDVPTLVEQDAPDIVVLDVHPPRMNGLRILRALRKAADTPIILVGSQARDEEIVRGLEAGADDYLPKPFSIKQLIARTHAVLRRARHVRSSAPTVLETGALQVDLESHELRHPSGAVRLTPLQFRILVPLMRNAGRVVSRERLVAQGWGSEGIDANVLKTHVSHIRKLIGASPQEPGYIENVPRVGYLLRA